MMRVPTNRTEPIIASHSRPSKTNPTIARIAQTASNTMIKVHTLEEYEEWGHDERSLTTPTASDPSPFAFRVQAMPVRTCGRSHPRHLL